MPPHSSHTSPTISIICICVKVLEHTADSLGGRQKREGSVGRVVEPARLVVRGFAQACAANSAGFCPKVQPSPRGEKNRPVSDPCGSAKRTTPPHATNIILLGR